MAYRGYRSQDSSLYQNRPRGSYVRTNSSRGRARSYSYSNSNFNSNSNSNSSSFFQQNKQLSILSLYMIFLYKTRTCHNLPNCPYGDNCFDSHTSPPERRYLRWQGNYWNYNPTKCTHGWADANDCRPGCGKAHSTNELRYHPDEYKVYACRNYPNCPRGSICHLYHERTEQRHRGSKDLPESLEQCGIKNNDNPPTEYIKWLESSLAVNDNSHQNVHSSSTPPPPTPPSLPPQTVKKENKDDIISESQVNEMKEFENIHNYLDNDQVRQFLKTYKTEKCNSCEKNINPLCHAFHNSEDRRRAFDDNDQTYHYLMCSNVFDMDKKEFIRTNKEIVSCPDGDQCPMSHNFYEIWFHPYIYRTVYCPFMAKNGSCQWGDLCSHYHHENEKRQQL